MVVKLKRVYEPADRDDGQRFLVERLWPRGIRKETLADVVWLKEAAPGADLRRWFGHDPEKWEEFRRRYVAELERNPTAWEPLLEAAARGTVTLLYSSHDREHNNAVVLKEFLEERG